MSRDVPELLPFTFYYKEIFVKTPSGIKYEALKAANMSSTNMTRMVLVPPKAPPEMIATLRQAFDSLAKDQDFLEDAIKTMRSQAKSFSNERHRRRPKSSIFCGSISIRLTDKTWPVAKGIAVTLTPVPFITWAD